MAKKVLKIVDLVKMVREINNIIEYVYGFKPVLVLRTDGNSGYINYLGQQLLVAYTGDDMLIDNTYDELRSIIIDEINDYVDVLRKLAYVKA